MLNPQYKYCPYSPIHFPIFVIFHKVRCQCHLAPTNLIQKVPLIVPMATRTKSIHCKLLLSPIQKSAAKLLHKGLFLSLSLTTCNQVCPELHEARHN